MAAGMGMGAAVALLMLFAAGVTKLIPVSALCLFVASLMTWVPIREERGALFSLILYVFVSLVSLLISRSSVYTYLYILLFGHYGLVRFILRVKLDDRFLTILIRLFIFNLLSAAGLAVCEFIVGYDVMTLVPELSVFAVFGIMQGCFIVYMLLYRFFTYLFDSALRSLLLPRR